MMLGGMLSALGRQQAAEYRAKMLQHHLRAMQNARAAEAQRIHGAAFAGLDAQGRVILWRRTTIPAVARKTDAGRGQE